MHRRAFSPPAAWRRSDSAPRRALESETGVGAAAPPIDLAPVKASWDRIIRTTVGLRPHRDAGFVLKPDKLDDKLLVHNYGHGGAGMSLAWGTGLMAAEFATEHQSRQAAVIGCGSVGLTCARQLQRRGFDVTIYALAVPPNVTSNMSLASSPPNPVSSRPTSGPRVVAQCRRAADIASYRRPAAAARRAAFGVSWLKQLFAGQRAARAGTESSRTTEPARRADGGAGAAAAGRASVSDEVRCDRRRSGSSRTSISTTWCATFSSGAATSSCASSRRRASSRRYASRS
jgi:hypothetical protein